MKWDREFSSGVIGPGGSSLQALKVLKNSSTPLVLYADALFDDWLLPRSKRSLCTPNPGEAARRRRCSAAQRICALVAVLVRLPLTLCVDQLDGWHGVDSLIGLAGQRRGWQAVRKQMQRLLLA